jgi:hypothetical protein
VIRDLVAAARLVVVVALASSLLACGGGSAGGPCTLGSVREESQACCLDLGIDACGAGLVCAALDGREQATCYREYSRRDLSECSDDRLCASASCNADSGRCRSAYGQACQLDTGCAPDPRGHGLSCREPIAGRLMCLRTDMQYEQPCTFDIECVSNDCACSRDERVCCNT